MNFLLSAVSVSEQPTLFPVSELRTDENIIPVAYCSEAHYNNVAHDAHDFDESGYSEPADGASQLEFAVPIPEAIPTPGLGDYGTGISSHGGIKDNQWADPRFQVFSFGSGPSGAVYVSHLPRGIFNVQY